MNQGNSFGIKHLIISFLFLVSFDTKRKASSRGWRGAFLFLTVAPGSPRSVPTAYVWPDGLDAWRQIHLSRTWLCLTSSTRLSFGSSRGGSVIPISLISLMRAEGAGPHFELVAQNELVCLAPSWIISVFRGRTALCNHFQKGLSLPSPGRRWALSRVPTWTEVRELRSPSCEFLNNENSECHLTG